MAVHRFIDVVIILGVLMIAAALAWLCSHTDAVLHPDESDCIEQLRAATRRTANYTQEEVVSYGHCLMDRRK